MVRFANAMTVPNTSYEYDDWSAKVSVIVSGDGPFADEPTLVTKTEPGNLPYDLGVTKGGMLGRVFLRPAYEAMWEHMK